MTACPERASRRVCEKNAENNKKLQNLSIVPRAARAYTGMNRVCLHPNI